MVSFAITLRADYRSQLLEEVPSYFDFAKTMILPEGKSRGRSMLLAEDSAQPNHPAQLCTLAALDAGYQEVVVAKPVRDGGTQVALVPMFRRAIKEKQRSLLAYPTMDSSKDIWGTKVGPTLEAYGGQEILDGGGSRGGAARLVKLPDGGEFMLRSAGGRGQSGQAAVHGDVIMLDELDDWEDEETILNMVKRVADSPSILVIYISTVKNDTDSKILKRLRLGTDTHLEFPCVHCGAFQRLVWLRVNLVKATYCCEHCPAEWSEADRRASLRNWKRVDKNPGAKAFSISWTCLDSPLVTLHNEIHGTAALPGYLAALHQVEVLGDHSQMRSFKRDRLCQVYTDDTQDEDGTNIVIDRKYLSDRSMAFGWAVPVVDLHPEKLWSRYVTEVPAEAEQVMVAVDVQGNRLYWDAVAFNMVGSEWDIAWGQERCRMHQVGNTWEPEPWGPGDLIQTLDRTAAFIATITTLPMIAPMVDTRYETEEIAIWLKNNRSWRGVVGVDSIREPAGEMEETAEIIRDLRGIPGLINYDRQWQPRLGRYRVLTTAARELVHDGFRKSPGEPGASLLPNGLPTNDHYIGHLCSHQLRRDPKTLKVKWVQVTKRDDHLDTRSYIKARIKLACERFIKEQKRARSMSSQQLIADHQAQRNMEIIKGR
jgi:hypothetical protein